MTLGENSNPVKEQAAYEIVADGDADREHWLRERSKLITASNVAAVLDQAPGKVALWYELAGAVQPEDSGAEYLRFGQESEPFNAQLYEWRSKRKTKRVQLLLRSTRYPWLGATLDYQTIELPPAGTVIEKNGAHLPWVGSHLSLPAPVELKSTGKKDNWPEDEEPSLRWQLQLQTQLIVVGAEWGSISAILGSPYLHHRWEDIGRHEPTCRVIIERTREFWESVQRGIPPEADGSYETGNALSRAHLGQEHDDVVELPAMAELWDEMLVAAREREKQAKADIRLYEQLLEQALGEHRYGVLPGVTDFHYSFKTRQRRGYTVEPTTYRSLYRHKGLPK